MIETMNCPVCQQALKSTLVQSIPLDVCNVCGGIWLDRGELPKIALADISTLDLPMTHRNLSLQNQPKHCPRDQMPLRKKTFIEDQAVVDECPKCAGIWVDHLKEFLQVVSDFKQKKNLDRTQVQDYFAKYNKDRKGDSSTSSIVHSSKGGAGAAIVGSAKVITDAMTNYKQGGISNVLGKRAVLEAIIIPIIILLLIIAYGYFFK